MNIYFRSKSTLIHNIILNQNFLLRFSKSSDLHFQKKSNLSWIKDIVGKFGDAVVAWINPRSASGRTAVRISAATVLFFNSR